MRSRTVLMSISLAALSLVSGNALLHSQAAEPQNSKTFGYQDSKTGIFHPLTASGPTENTSTAFTGTITVKLNITVKSAWPATSTRTIVCSAEFIENSLTASAQGSSYQEYASRNATLSGTTYSCFMSIPYSWLIPSTAIQNSLIGSYSVGVQNSTATAGPPLLRETTGPVVSLTALPANGTTSAYVISVVI